MVAQHFVYVSDMASSCMNSLKSSEQLVCSTQTQGESYADSEAHYNTFLCDKRPKRSKIQMFLTVACSDRHIILNRVLSNTVIQKLDTDS